MENQLSSRQYEVVERIVFCGTKKEAADSLGISPRTMETHTKIIYRILKITKINELILWYCSLEFNIQEQIKEKQEKLTKIIKEKKREIGAICLVISTFISLTYDHHEGLRYRRYRREVEIEYAISSVTVHGS